MVQEYVKLRAEMDEAHSGSSIRPEHFMNALNRNQRQFEWKSAAHAEDLMESLLKLLDHDFRAYNRAPPIPDPSDPNRDLNHPPPPDRSIIPELFSVTVRRRVACDHCQCAPSTAREMKLVPIVVDYNKKLGRPELDESIRAQFLEHESPDDFCTRASCRHRGVTVSEAFEALPPVLIFLVRLPELPQFPEGAVLSSCEHLVFPDELDLAPYHLPTQQASEGERRPIMYTLKAVVRHFELNPLGLCAPRRPGQPAPSGLGHFKAYIRIGASDYCFDDRLVCASPCGTDYDYAQVRLLMYERR
jgi:ubiquitin C-terminal hydrolase